MLIGKVRIAILLTSVLLLLPGLAASADYAGGLLFGYSGGPGGQMSITVADFAQELPFQARFGVGYAGVEPGSAEDARKIFINNATNGIPEEAGRIWDARLDLMLPIKPAFFREMFLFGGPRLSSFTANFKYVGGNEDFDVRSRQWGIGLGIEGRTAMTPSTDLVLSGGADYFRAGTLDGHDTAYSPGDDDVNPREDFTYNDADAAIDQPEIVTQVFVGFHHRFGR